MNPTTKKIIAREGLVIIGIILFGIAIIQLSILLRPSLDAIFSDRLGRRRILDSIPYGQTIAFGWLIVIYGYPIYLFIRFIIWAIRTLKEK